MVKRIFSVLIAVLMVLGTMSFNVFAEETITVDSAGGFGTEENPIRINTAEDLMALCDNVNNGDNYAGKYVMLNDNIDLSSVPNWTPIGDTTYNKQYVPVDASVVFSGVFDGNGKVISNLKIERTLGKGADADANLGLFGIIGEGAVIKDLTITNVDINTDGRNVGALAGVAYKATLENITVNGNIQITGGNNVCGVCAMTRYYDVSATNITVSGNNGSSINGNNIVAGIFAEIAPNGSNQIFENLSIENVEINGVGGVGGIVGLLTNGTISNVSVKDVELVGKTTWKENEGRVRIGSIAGLLGSTSATISDVVAVENVTAKNLEGEDVKLPVIGANYDGSIGNATEAKIGDTYYAKFDTAFNKLENGETLTLLADVDLTAPITIDKTVTLDLNGYSVTYESTTQGEAMITNKGDLTINDSVGGGEIVCTFVGTPDTSFGKGNYTISNGGNLIVNGGAIKEASEAMSHMRSAIDNNSCGNSSAYVTINGGEVISTNYIAIRQFAGGENKVTINGGTVTGGKRALWMQAASSTGAPVIELAVNGGKLVSNDKSGDNLAIYSYSYGASLENVKLNISGGEFDGDIALSGGKNKTVAETVTVTSGKFNDIYSYADDAVAKETIVIKGGEFAAGEYAATYVANGFKLGADGKVVVNAALPDATVSKLEPFVLEADSYLAWPSGDTKVKRPLDVVMCFEAKDTLEEAQASGFGKWICDFYLTVDGLENGTALADGCYLAGEYGEYGWIVIPTDGITLTNGETMPVVSAYDANLTYENICDYVKKFTAAIYINPQLIAANPGMTVTLELRMKNPETEEFYTVGQPYTYETLEFATDNAVTDVDGGVYADGSAAVIFNTQFDEANILEDASYGAFVYKKGNTNGAKVTLSGVNEERYTSIIVNEIPAASFDEYIVCVPYMIRNNTVTLGNVRTVKAGDFTKNLVK